MIRDRRTEDVAVLCDVLRELDGHAAALAPQRPEDWLQDDDALCSWVFDQAPVSVVPTRNVIGHVRVCPATAARWADTLADELQVRPRDLLVITRLFVKPVAHQHGIARFLLRESTRYVEDRGCVAVLDPAGVALVPAAPVASLGFTERATRDAAGPVLVRTGSP